MALGATSALCDFLFMPIVASIDGPPITWRAVVALAVVGCTLAQGNLLAVWLVWSSDYFPRRLAIHWGTAGVLYLCWVVGFSLVGDHEFWEVGGMVALLVPIVSLGAQLPHWIMRHFFGWRLVRLESNADKQRDAPLTIRDLFLATIVVAVTFGIARRGPVVAPPMNGFWALIALMMAVAGTISTIALLPAGVLLMRTKDFQRGLIWGGIYSLALVSLVWLVVGIVWWFEPALLVPYQFYVGLSALMLSFAGTLMVAAAVARASGYRLASWRDAGKQSGSKATAVTLSKTNPKSVAAD